RPGCGATKTLIPSPDGAVHSPQVHCTSNVKASNHQAFDSGASPAHQLPGRCSKLLWIEGFRQDQVHLCEQIRCERVWRGGDYYERVMWCQGLDYQSQLVSFHIRHVVVEHHQVEPVLLIKNQPLSSIDGC